MTLLRYYAAPGAFVDAAERVSPDYIYDARFVTGIYAIN